jgi:hypothetical protein
VIAASTILREYAIAFPCIGKRLTPRSRACFTDRNQLRNGLSK